MKRVLVLCVGGAVIVVLGCATETLMGSPGLRRFASLRMKPHSVSMVVGATQQFTLEARDSLGVVIPLSELPAPTYTSFVDTAVRITPDGIATARFTNTGVRILGKIVVDNLAYAETAFVAVVAAAPTAGPPATFLITPVVGSTVVSTVPAGTSVTLIDSVRTSGGTKITTRQPYYVSSDRLKATVNTNRVTALSPGTVQVIGAITAFGVDLVDTISLTITNPTALTVSIVLADGKAAFGGAGKVTIAPGGVVTWTNNTGAPNANPPVAAVPMDVTFDNPTNVTAATTGGASGNIPAFTTGSQARKFPVVGTYTYRSTTNGATGVVIVK